MTGQGLARTLPGVKAFRTLLPLTIPGQEARQSRSNGDIKCRLSIYFRNPGRRRFETFEWRFGSHLAISKFYGSVWDGVAAGVTLIKSFFMAKVLDMHVSGTIGNICIYRLDGHTYARAKSTLSRKQVLESKAFESTRKHAGDMGRAARIGSAVYRALPAAEKGRPVYQTITGEAASLLYKGIEEEEVRAILWEKYIQRAGKGHLVSQS